MIASEVGKKRMILLNGSLLLLFLASTSVFIDAQREMVTTISIDCGIPDGSNYADEETGIAYTSDSDYIYTGENRAISSSGSENLKPRILRTLRTFPEGGRNCYTLGPIFKDKYLVRGWFFYGHIDNDTITHPIEIPSFDVYLGLNLWDSISHSDSISEHGKVIEAIVTAKRDYIEVCLMRKIGNPYISALDLRILDNEMYSCQTAVDDVLFLRHRYNLGANSNQSFLRYRDDDYDRVWTPYPNTRSSDPQPPWRVLTANPSVTFTDTDPRYLPPDEVMRTAVAPLNDTQPLVFTFAGTPPGREDACIYLHLAELEMKKGKLREFAVKSELVRTETQFRPVYLQTATFQIRPVDYVSDQSYTVSFSRTLETDLPPLLNAIEIYSQPTSWEISLTQEDDVSAIMGVREEYRVKKNWMGDPCLPENYTWNGLICSYSDAGLRIVSLNLSFSGLHGNISDSFAKLSALTSLDLSGNNLSGEVPSLMGDMKGLISLNLSQNNFTGILPSNLLDKSKAKSLQLSFDGNPYLISGKGLNKTNLIVEISVPSAFLILGIIFILWWKLRTRKQNMAGSFCLDSRRFTYKELKHMTKDFSRVIGKGGFGVVYYGQLDDGTHVAVKMISYGFSSSSEFQIEAQLLIRVHHRNLVQFIGYCADGKHKALVLEFMSRGNLDTILSESENNNIIVTWGQRLHIALDIAQGLEYLHVGCKPPIIHRDVKLTNILLNDKFQAKIADFGVSKVFYNDDCCTHISTLVKGTFGYLDPEYCVSNNLNEKSDVYAFGIVLLELITGKRAIIQVSEEDKISIAEWVGNYMSTADLSSVVDPRLDGDWDADSAWTVTQIAIASTRPKRAHRPSMSDVVIQLKEYMGVEKVSSRAGSLHGDTSSESCDVIESLDFVERESNASSESLFPLHFPQQGPANSFSVESNGLMYERSEGSLSKTV